MPAPHHEFDPERADIDAGLEEPPEVEELRFAEGPMVVMDRHFGDPEPGVGDLLHHLEADDPAVAAELDPVEDRSPHQAEITVDVPQAQSEEDRHDMVVRP